MQPINTYKLYLIILLPAISMRYIEPLNSYTFLRYSIYAVPIIFFIISFFISGPKDKIEFNFKILDQLGKLIFLSMLYLFLICLILNKFSYRFVSEFIFITFPIISCKILFLYYKNNIDLDKTCNYVFYTFVFAYFINLGSDIFSLPTFIMEIITSKMLATRFDQFAFENGLSFLFGYFSIFYFSLKKYKHFYFAIIMTIISYKRIAVFGVLIAILYLLFGKKIISKKYIPFLMVSTNLFFLYIFYLVLIGFFDPIISDLFGLSTKNLLNGRLGLFDRVLNITDFNFWGNGLGYVYLTLESLSSTMNKVMTVVHSDIIKIYMEGGFVLLTFFIFFLYRFTSYSHAAIAQTLYLNILFITDNIFIYMPELFVFYFLQAILYFEYNK